MQSGDVIATTSAGWQGTRCVRSRRAPARCCQDVAFGKYEQFSFIGWNDETVHGYVVKPWNYEAGKKYPVAFLIHGGPQGSFGDGWSYRWNPQTYAGQGYAVVMIDFHGSTGYGQAFTDAISQHWGDRPLEDLQKGWAAAQQKYAFLDGDKACALGASYGGFMVNWIAGNWYDKDGKSPWKCLVSHDGVFDQRAMGYATEELWFNEWENGGTVFDNPENYEKFNPVSACRATSRCRCWWSTGRRTIASRWSRASRCSPPCSARAWNRSSCISRTRTTGCSSRRTACSGMTPSTGG